MNKLAVDLRPKRLKTFHGNVQVKKAIEEFIKSSVSGTFLLAGESGCGKTSLSRILKNELEVNDLNFKEYTVSTEAKVEMAREFVEEVQRNRIVSGNRLFILNEIHQAKKQFQEILLDVLEHPPKNTFIVLCTTEPEKLKKAVKGRCISFYLKHFNKKESYSFIERVSKKVKFDIAENIKKAIFLKAGGVPREMVNLIEVCSKLEDTESMLSYIDSYSGVASDTDIVQLCNAMLKKENFSSIVSIAENINSEPESIRRAVLAYCASVLKKNGTRQAALIINCFSEPYYDTGIAGLYLSIFNVVE